MKINLTKKGKVVIFVILGIIVLGSGGYLLWRVLQPETVAPEDSEAGGGYGTCCLPSVGCVSGYVCNTDKICTTDESAYFGGYGPICGTNTSGQQLNCRSGFYCVYPSQNLCRPGSNMGTCDEESGEPTEGDCKDVKCEWPTVVMSQLNCACKQCDEVSGVCSGNPGKCTPSSCPSGYVSCGISGESGISGEGCKKIASTICWGNHSDCNNPFVVYRYCKPETQEPTNTCEGGNWLDKPTGEYPYGTELNPITIRTTDTDGLGTVTVKVNSNSVPTCGPTVGVTCYTKENKDIKMYIDPGQQYMGSDNYAMTITWKDGKEVGGDNCTKSTTFTILEEPEACGDGTLDEGEQCEEGNPSGVVCTWSECNQDICQCPTEPEPYCGDGDLNEGEECELGNPTGYTCTWEECNQNICQCPTEPEEECGDGILSEGEECELGNPNGYQCIWDQCDKELCLCEEQENPNWTIVKTATESCVVEEEETYAQAIYNITIKNIGEGEGSIDKIIDDLDEKVLESYLNDISGIGTYESGLITWDLEGEDETFSPDESMNFTYYIKVPAEAFGTYANVATAYPSEGENFTDSENVDLDCEIPEEPEEPEIPQTGIFDSVISKVILGLIMIVIGANWTSISKFNYSIREQIAYKRIKRFERKIAKDK